MYLPDKTERHSEDAQSSLSLEFIETSSPGSALFSEYYDILESNNEGTLMRGGNTMSSEHRRAFVSSLRKGMMIQSDT